MGVHQEMVCDVFNFSYRWELSLCSASPREAELFQIWKGIKYLWSPGGALETKQPPSGRYADPFEVAAAKITQSQLDKAMKDMKTYLTAWYVYLNHS